MGILFLETDKRWNLWNKNVSNEKLISKHCYPQNYDFARNRSLGSKKRGGRSVILCLLFIRVFVSSPRNHDLRGG